MVDEYFPLQCRSTLTAWTDRALGEAGSPFEHGLSMLRYIRQKRTSHIRLFRTLRKISCISEEPTYAS